MFENRFGSTDTFKMAADQRKMMGASFFQNAYLDIDLTFGQIFGAQGDLGCPFYFSYFKLGVTSRDRFF